MAVLDLEGTCDIAERLVALEGAHVINPLPIQPLIMAHRSSNFRQILGQACVNVPDGVGTLWSLRRAGWDASERVYGPDLMDRLIERGLRKGWRHNFVGGTPSSLECLKANLEAHYPGIRVAGTFAPPFEDVTPRRVRRTLEGLPGADITWVGLGTPKQQRWAAFALREESASGLIVTVGAAFDFKSNTVRQAPKFVRDSGFEWLFRLAMEPRRLFRKVVIDSTHYLLAPPAHRCSCSEMARRWTS